MRELTEEETLSVSGGTREGATQLTSNSQNLLGPAFGAHRGVAGIFQPMRELDVRGAVDATIMES